MNQVTTKICNTCLVEYPVTSEYFYTQKKHSQDGLKKRCKKCDKIVESKNDSPIIYAIVHKETKQIYVGQTRKTLEHRVSGHFRRSTEGSGLLLQLIRKENYDREKFSFLILEHLNSVDELDEAERKWIEKFKVDGRTLLNLQSGGKKGQTNSLITNKQISESKKGIKQTEQHVARRFASMIFNGSFIGGRGGSWSEEAKREQSKRMRGHKYQTGSKNSRATITEETVRLVIDLLIKQTPPKEIERITGVSTKKISDINTRRAWSSVVVEGYENKKVYFEQRKKAKTT